MLEYVAKFTQLARFANDYVATDMAKVRKFEDGLQDMDYMVRTAMAIGREIEDARSIRDAGSSEKRRENKSSSSSGKMQRTSASPGF